MDSDDCRNYDIVCGYLSIPHYCIDNNDTLSLWCDNGLFESLSLVYTRFYNQNLNKKTSFETPFY